jgi:nucleolar protein 4
MQPSCLLSQVEELVRPVPDDLAAQFKLRRDGCTGEAFLAVYKSVKQAMEAVAKLHGQTVASSSGGAAGGNGNKRKGGEQAGGAGGGDCRVWARQLSGDGLHQKRWRLVVRNLPFTVSCLAEAFSGLVMGRGCQPSVHRPAHAPMLPFACHLVQATEADLRAAFSSAGFVWELTLPRSASGRSRGFAFVGFTCKLHAERAIVLLNGQAVAGRPVAVDWAVAKAQYSPTAQQEEVPAQREGRAGEQRDRDVWGLDSEDEARGPPAKLVSRLPRWQGLCCGASSCHLCSQCMQQLPCTVAELTGGGLTSPCRAMRRMRKRQLRLWSLSMSGACCPASSMASWAARAAAQMLRLTWQH